MQAHARFRSYSLPCINEAIFEVKLSTARSPSVPLFQLGSIFFVTRSVFPMLLGREFLPLYFDERVVGESILIWREEVRFLELFRSQFELVFCPLFFHGSESKVDFSPFVEI